MLRIERPAIEANVGTIPALLDKPLRAVMARLAQTLKRPQPKLIHVTTMWLDVIADLRWGDDAALKAELA